MEARAHDDKLDVAGSVRIRRRRAVVDAHLPALRRLGRQGRKTSQHEHRYGKRTLHSVSPSWSDTIIDGQ